MKYKIKSIAVIVFGLVLTTYGVIGVEEYGFYISGRGDPTQTEGGLAPFFLLLGVLAIGYGYIELKLIDKSNKSEERKDKQ